MTYIDNVGGMTPSYDDDKSVPPPDIRPAPMIVGRFAAAKPLFKSIRDIVRGTSPPAEQVNNDIVDDKK